MAKLSARGRVTVHSVLKTRNMVVFKHRLMSDGIELRWDSVGKWWSTRSKLPPEYTADKWLASMLAAGWQVESGVGGGELKVKAPAPVKPVAGGFSDADLAAEMARRGLVVK